MITASTAQESSNSGISKIKNWSVATYLGWTIGGPCKQIEESMVIYGFDDRKEGGWFSDSHTYHPYTEHHKPSWMISVKYYMNSSFSVGIIGGKTHLGSTYGYNCTNANVGGGDINIEYALYYLSPILSFNSYDIVRIGIGPSIYFTKAWESSDHPEGIDVEYKHTKIGFLVDFGLRIPKKSLFFFELNGQYRYVGKVEIGPFTVYEDTFPKTKVNYNHWLIGIGFGVRF